MRHLHRKPRLLEDADKLLAEAEEQLDNLQGVSEALKKPSAIATERSSREAREKLFSTGKPSEEIDESEEIPHNRAADQYEGQTTREDAPIIVGSVHHNPEVLKYNFTPSVPSHHDPIIFTSKKSDSNETEGNNTGRIHLDFDSDFKTGYTKVAPSPSPSKEPENPWLTVYSPEEEAQLEEQELSKKIADSENLTATALHDPSADKETTRDLLLITGLGRKSQKLMDQLDQLMSIQGAESTPEVIAEAKKLLEIYDKMKKQIADTIMKYSSYHDFEGGYRSSNDTLTFPMENPRPPPGQLDVVPTKKRNRHPGYREAATVGGAANAAAETVYTPLERPKKPVIE